MSTGRGETELEEPTRLQRSIARRVAESRATIPHLELSAEVHVDDPDRLATNGGVRAAVVRACALALREVRKANGAYRDGHFELYSRVNIGVAVPSGGAYVLATLFDADEKTAQQLAAEIEGFGARELTPPELSGATFAVWDLGDADSGAPVIVPGHAAALAVGAIHPAPVARRGAIVLGHVMTITLACDNRILFGTDAAGFLRSIRTHLEMGTT